MDLSKLKSTYTHGTLTCKYGTVTVKRMYLSNEMKQKLNNMINKGIRRNNQEFVINEITIADVDEDLFEKNQCDLIISNNMITSHGGSDINPLFFDGEFVVVLYKDDNHIHTAEYILKIEKISLKLDLNKKNVDEDEITYSDVETLVNACGKCFLESVEE